MGWWGSIFRSRPPGWSRFDDGKQFDAFIHLYLSACGVAAGSVIQRRLAGQLQQVLMLDTSVDKELVRTQSVIHTGESFDVLVSNGGYTGAALAAVLGERPPARGR